MGIQLSARKLAVVTQHMWCKGHHTWEAASEFDLNPATNKPFNRCRRCKSGRAVRRAKQR